MRLRGWETLVALAAATVAGVRLRGDFFDHAASQIVTLLSLLMAAVIPTMILTVNSMRSSIFTVNQVRNLRNALMGQVNMLSGLFIYALLACVVVITGVATSWPAWKNFAPFSFIIFFFLAFLVLRAFTVIRGINGLLQLAGELAEKEAEERAEKLKKIDELENYEQPRDYGAAFDFQH